MERVSFVRHETMDLLPEQASFMNELVPISLDMPFNTKTGNKSSDPSSLCLEASEHDGENINLIRSSQDNNCNREYLNLCSEKEKYLKYEGYLKINLENDTSKRKIRNSESDEIHSLSTVDDVFREISSLDKTSAYHKSRDGSWAAKIELLLPVESLQPFSLGSSSSNDWEDSDSQEPSISSSVNDDNCSISEYYDAFEGSERFHQQEMVTIETLKLEADTLKVKNADSILGLDSLNENWGAPSKFILGDKVQGENIFFCSGRKNESLVSNLNRYQAEFLMSDDSTQPSLDMVSNDSEDNDSLEPSTSFSVNDDNWSMSGNYDDDGDLERFCQQKIIQMKKMMLEAETLKVENGDSVANMASDEDYETPMSKFVRSVEPTEDLFTRSRSRDESLVPNMPKRDRTEFLLSQNYPYAFSLGNVSCNEWNENDSPEPSTPSSVSDDNWSLSGYYDDDEDLERFCQQEKIAMKKIELETETFKVRNDDSNTSLASDKNYETSIYRDVVPTEDPFTRSRSGDGSLVPNMPRKSPTKFLLSQNSPYAFSLDNMSCNEWNENDSSEPSTPSSVSDDNWSLSGYYDDDESGRFCQQEKITMKKIELEMETLRVDNDDSITSLASKENCGTPTSKFQLINVEPTEHFIWPETSANAQSRGPLNEHDLLMQVQKFFLENPVVPKTKLADELLQHNGPTADEIKMVSIEAGMENDTAIKTESFEPLI